MCRPAWRIIHTGVRSTRSPRAARSSSGAVPPEVAFGAAAAPVCGAADMVIERPDAQPTSAKRPAERIGIMRISWVSEIPMSELRRPRAPRVVGSRVWVSWVTSARRTISTPSARV